MMTTTLKYSLEVELHQFKCEGNYASFWDEFLYKSIT